MPVPVLNTVEQVTVKAALKQYLATFAGIFDHPTAKEVREQKLDEVNRILEKLGIDK